MAKRKTREEFIADAKKVHGSKYDYTLVEYVNTKAKVIIICPTHGQFLQNPNNHLQGSECPRCSGNVKKTLEEFISQSKDIHGDKYDYSKTVYKTANGKVIITCKIHGDFEQKPNDHLSNHGCKKCGTDLVMSKKTSNTEEFLSKAKAIHGNKYIYDDVEYVHNKNKVKIICPEHGIFEQPPNSHLSGVGCPKCGAVTAGKNITLNALNKRDWNFEQPEEYKLIPLTKGEFTMVDNEDFEHLSQFNWYLSNGYVYNRELGFIHRYIMNCPDHLEVDHENHNGSDNRRCNLRIATRSLNMANRRSGGGSSIYIGVSRSRGDCKWVSEIVKDGVKFRLGRFTTEDEAGRARDLKALELFGEFAYLNFPELKEEYLKQLENIKIC